MSLVAAIGSPPAKTGDAVRLDASECLIGGETVPAAGLYVRFDATATIDRRT